MTEKTIAVAGLGAIGSEIVRALAQGIPGLRLSAIAAQDRGRARERLRGFGLDVPVCALDELANHADIVVECLPPHLFRDVAEPVITAGRTLVMLSTAALLDHEDLLEQARRRGARILVPSGGIAGLDGVRAAAEGEIRSVTIRSSKPPTAFAGSAYVQANNIVLEGLAEPLRLFRGTAREGGRAFPTSVNVAVSLGLAGLGVDRTILEIWADPAISRNVHRIDVESDAATFSVRIENKPSPENPRSSRMAALSTIALLRDLAAPVRIGS